MGQPRVPVDDAKLIAKARGLDGVIVIGMTFKGEAKCCITSYGRTKGLCEAMDRVAQKIEDGIQKGVIEP